MITPVLQKTLGSTGRVKMIKASKYSAFEGTICDKGFHEVPSAKYFLRANVFYFFQHKPPSCQNRDKLSERQGLCFLVSKLESLESKPKSTDPKHESLDSSINVRSFLVSRNQLNRLNDCQLTFGRYCTSANALAKDTAFQNYSSGEPQRASGKQPIINSRKYKYSHDA